MGSTIAKKALAAGRWVAGRPPSWLLLLAIATFVFHAAGDSFEPVKQPDTESYQKLLEAESLTRVLSFYRTYGYPLYIRLLGVVGLRWGMIPEATLVLYLLGVGALWKGLQTYTERPWLSFAAVAPLFTADILGFMPILQPDALASALTLAAVGATLALVARPASRLAWAAVALLVPAIYHARPAAVFLVGWLPLLAGGLWVLRDGWRAHRLIRRMALLAALTALPLAAYSALRYAVVGHFGLVSFGGYNVSAVTSSFLTAGLVEEIPEDVRPMARRILDRRRQRGWQAMALGGSTESWFEQYNTNLWDINARVAWSMARKAHRGAGGPAPTHVLVNDRLNRFARAVIRQRPRLYLQWVRDAFLDGLARLWADGLVRLLLAAIVMTVPFFAFGGRRPRARADGRPGPLAAIYLSGIGYFAVYLSLTSLVSFPFARYFASIALFVPGVLAAGLFEMWRGILAGGGWATGEP